ncbi:uncharacterized protein LOC132757799, partial [Ruditapes philippinarum]|uniref:uncharacterized protein LOC132757799 n=1 Tax=Ruditapes philippinarum TaxID=129788 RepID=UPI00295B5D29
MSSKENMPPVKDRKSKIPVPSMLPVRKGIKRAVSPNACKSDPKRSPSTSKRSSTMNKGRPETRQFGNQQRKILGELPCEQRKIVKVHRALNKSPLTKQKAAKRQPMVKRSTLKKETGVSSCTSGFGVGDLSLLPDQSGIEFETDDSALQSILDETGIQYVQPQHGNQPQMSKFSRHTLAAVPKAQKESIGPSRIKVEDFRKVCDDFISRTTSKQPNAKRHCREPEFKNEDNFNLKLTPSKTDFCKKFGVEKNITFKGVTPGYASRQSLPGRTKVRQPDPFIIPGRCSMIGQASRRLAMVGEEEILSVTPGRASIAPQTPLRVPKKIKNMEDAAQLENEVFSGNVNRHQTPGRVSLSSQKPGRVSLSAQNPGRPSLSSQTPGRVSLSAQTPGRTSLAPQTPSRASLYDKSCNIQSVGRPSLITQPPGRVSLSAQHPPQYCQNKYDNLSSEGKPTQTPGRVSLSSVQNSRQHRVSMIDQTPGRVKIQDQSKDKADNDTKKTDSICENLAKRFLMDTPEKVDNPDTMSKVSKNKTPVREKAAGTCATPLRVKLLQTDQSTPKSTPQRVLKPANTLQHTPQRVQVQGVTKSSSTPQEPMRVAKKVGTPITPIRVSVMSPGVLPRQPADIKQETPSRKTPSKSKMSDGVDLRTIWKTKKTPSKSPIMKEVLVKEEEGSSSDVSTPKNHKEGLPGAVAISIKKKKTLTWADALESCQTTTGVSETKDEQCASLQIKPETFHYAMQDSPNQEKTTSSPDKNTHVTTLTNSLNSLNNMQLPVCLTGSSST